MVNLFGWLKRKKPVSTGKATEEKLAEVGKVTHYFPHVKAAVIELTGMLRAGDKISIKGHTTNFEQTIKSMQSNNTDVTEAGKGKVVGIIVKERVREHDIVYKK